MTKNWPRRNGPRISASAIPLGVRQRPPIVPLAVYAPGQQAFEVCTINPPDADFSEHAHVYVLTNPDFAREGWGKIGVEFVKVCPHGRAHWKIARVGT